MPELRLAPSWQDPGWSTALRRLPPTQRFLLEQSLRELAVALTRCLDPARDPALQRWSPSRWDTAGRQAGHGQWVEYRLGDHDNRARAIVCHDRDKGVIFMVARTVIHDHDTLRRLVARFNP